MLALADLGILGESELGHFSSLLDSLRRVAIAIAPTPRV